MKHTPWSILFALAAGLILASAARGQAPLPGISGTASSSGGGGTTPGYQPNQTLAGCGVEYVSGLTFTVGACQYTIGGTTYNSVETSVTLTAADPTNPRIDVIGVDNTSAVFSTIGTPAVSPAEPAVDPATQLGLIFVTIAANATTPSGIVNTPLYLENTEWTCASTTHINCASTTNPYQGTKDIEATAAVLGNNFTLIKPASGTVDLSTQNNLIFYIRSKGTWPSANNTGGSGLRTLSLFWLNGSTQVGTPIVIRDGVFGFSSGSTSAYQQISIPIPLFGAGSNPVTTLKAQVTGNGGTSSFGWYIDDVTLQSGTNQITLPTTLMNFQNTWSSTKSYNPNDTVVNNGTGYVALAANTNVSPAVSPGTWQPLAPNPGINPVTAYQASGVPITFGTTTSGVNTVTVLDPSSWASGMGIFIPDVITNSATGGTVCDHVTVSGSTLTMLTGANAACNANATIGNNLAPILHWSMTKGAITTATNSLTVVSPTTFLSGQGIRVAGAGAAGADLICAKITVVGTVFTLLQSDGVTACNASTTVTTALVFHDDSYAMQTAAATGLNLAIPNGTFYITSEVDFSNSASMTGEGQFQSIFITAKDNINTFVAKANNISLRNFGIFQSDSFTASGGAAVTTCASSIKCYDDNFESLYIYRHWHQFDVVQATYRTHITNNHGIMAQSVAAYVNNPTPNGDIYWTNNHFDACSNSATCNTATGVLIDQADTEWFVGDKFNSFEYALRITGSNGIVEHQRFVGISIEGHTTLTNDFMVKIEKLASNVVNNITISGAEIGCCNSGASTANLMYIGNGATDIAIGDSNFPWTNGTSGATCLQIDGQSVSITGSVFYQCNDGISLGATAANVSIANNSFHSLNGTGISGTTGASHISTINNTFSSVSRGNVFLPPGSQDPSTIGTLWDAAKSLTIQSDVMAGASSDNFDRANAVTLGSNWTTYRGTFTVANNAVAYTVNPTNMGMAAWTGASFNSDQHARITAIAATANATNFGPAIRIQAAGNHAFYWATVDAGTTYILYVSNPAAGTNATVASVAGGWTAGDIIDLVASGTTLTIYKNGASIVSGTDANLSGGAPGLAVNTVTVPQTLMDNWAGGNAGPDTVTLNGNSIGGLVASAYVATSQSTSSATDVDLATADTVTFTTSGTHNLLIRYVAQTFNTTAAKGCTSEFYFDTVDASIYANQQQGATGSTPEAVSGEYIRSSVGPGSHTVNVKHRVESNTCSWLFRTISVYLAP